jgi:predicted NBD/HSP70 family sugar kinase
MTAAPITADLSLMRELNQALVLSLVRQEGHISRAEIAKRTNLSRSTVSNIINELIDANRIHEVQKGVSRGGRRPILLELNYRSHWAIGVELATTYLNLIITDLKAVVLHQQSVAFDINAGPDQAVAQVRQLVCDAIERTQIDPGRVAGIGIGVPGPLTYATGKTIAPPIMPGWSGVSLRERFAEALQLPVSVDNDANLGALAEYLWGVGQGVRHMAYLYLGTGVGAGLVLNGAIYRGEIGSAGEIGHITIDEDGPQCSCGSYGCLEAMVSVPRLLEQAAALNGGALRTLDEIVHSMHNGDHTVAQLFRTSGTHLGVAVANLLNLTNPGLVVLGGPLAAAGAVLIDTVSTVARQRALAISAEHCQIVAGALGADAVALGAASQIIQGVFSPPTIDSLVGQL